MFGFNENKRREGFAINGVKCIACGIFIDASNPSDWMLYALEVSVWCETSIPNEYTMTVNYSDSYKSVELRFHTQQAYDAFDKAFREAEDEQ